MPAARPIVSPVRPAGVDGVLPAAGWFTFPKILLLLGIWVAYTAVLGALYVVTPPSPDLSIFDYIGWRVLSGDTLYVDVIEQNWPGAMWLHTLSVWLFGNHLWSFRLFDYALMVAGACGLFLLGASSGMRWTGFIAVPLYQMMYVTSSPWLTGQRDIVAGHVLILLAVLYLRAGMASRIRWMCVFGAGMALVVMTRPTYLLFPLCLIGFNLMARYRDPEVRQAIVKDGAVALLAFLATLAAIATYGAYTGGLQGWYEAAVVYNLSAYSGTASFKEVFSTLVSTVFSWHWYYAFSILGFVLWLVHGRGDTLLALSCIVLTALVSFVVQGKAFGYHLAVVLPVLALLSAQSIAWACDAINRRREPVILMVAVLVLLIAAAGSVKKMYSSFRLQGQYLSGQINRQSYLDQTGYDFEGMTLGDAVSVSTYLGSHSTNQDTVLVWNRGIIVNFLSERRSPVPYATIGMLHQFRHTSELSTAWLSRLERVLECSPPKYLILGAKAVVTQSAMADSTAQSAPLHPADAILAKAISNQYRPEGTIGGAHLWMLDANWQPSCR